LESQRETGQTFGGVKASVVGFISRWFRREEILPEALCVIANQLLYPAGIGRFHDQANMVLFVVQAPDNFRIVVRRGVRMLLPRQRNEQTGAIASRNWRPVWGLSTSDFDLGPLRPEIDSCSRFHQISDMRATDTGGGLQEIQSAVATRDKFAVRDASHQTKGLQNFFVERQQRTFFRRASGQGAR